MSVDLVHFLERLGQPRILVLGDLMLDRYIWGDAERISQEAPVVLLRADQREERLGGASSVATMLRALEARVHLAGVVGDDNAGQRIRQLLDELCVDQTGVIRDPKRPTTVKERYMGRAQARHPQQMLRVDYETRMPLQGRLRESLLAEVLAQLPTMDLVLISDYDKGVCTSEVLHQVIAAARQLNIPVLADPVRGSDYRRYHGCTALTPNRQEASLATGLTISNSEDAYLAGKTLCAQLDLAAAIITLDKDGMLLVQPDGEPKRYPTRPRQVYDITGAGDMVLSVLGVCLAAGADHDTAIRLANVAGGLEVEKIGVAPVTRAEILHDLMHSGAGLAEPERRDGKLMALPALLGELEMRRRHGQRVAFTNGCFDILHAGHVQYLCEAQAQADLLVVGLNTDDSVRRLKGQDRPLNALDARALVLAGLRYVDYLTIFDSPTPIELIEAIRPDVLVKGADYRKEEVVGASLVESYGGRVHLAPLRPGFSSSHLLKQLQVA